MLNLEATDNPTPATGCQSSPIPQQPVMDDAEVTFTPGDAECTFGSEPRSTATDGFREKRTSKGDGVRRPDGIETMLIGKLGRLN